MSTLVTGACGFIGCNVVEQLLAGGRSVTAVDLDHNWPADAETHFGRLPGQLRFFAADVLDELALHRVLESTPAAGVIHAAAITPGREREARDADLIARVNLLGTLRVLAAARTHGVRRVVYPSSASVYGAAAFPPRSLDEGRDVPIPNATYGITKYAAERTALRMRELWGMDVVAARVGAAFGPWERDTGVRDTLSGPMLATRAMLRGEAVVLTREGPCDWVYAPDVAGALIALLDAASPDHEVYHVSAGRHWTLAAWCRQLAARLGAELFRLDPNPDRATIELGARDRAPLSIERLLPLYQPRFGLSQALEHYLGWLGTRSPAWHAAW